MNQIRKVTARYKNADEYMWVQEEPENMGAWSHLLRNFHEVQLKLVARSASASPATGSHKQHEREQADLIQRAFAKSLVTN
jgi:2-oxoglutarate dehydrogenase E1 component